MSAPPAPSSTMRAVSRPSFAAIAIVARDAAACLAMFASASAHTK